MKPQVSVIIPYYKDLETTIGTIESLYDTIDIDNFEVVVVNDGSGNGYDIPKSYVRDNMKVLDTYVNNGVGQAFDVGAAYANSDNLILMGADIRFDKNGWASRMLNVVEKEPKAVICTECRGWQSKRKHYGADVIFYVENKHLSKHHPRKHIQDYRSVLEGRWRPKTGRGVYGIPSLMGAFYGVKKAWYYTIRGFELHYRWGVLEPMISLKSWRMGGKVLIDTENYTYHIFNRKPQRESQYEALVFNQLIVAGTVFGTYGVRYAKFLSQGEGGSWQRGSDMYQDKYESVNQLATYIQVSSPITAQELEKEMVDLSYQYHKQGCMFEVPGLVE